MKTKLFLIFFIILLTSCSNIHEPENIQLGDYETVINYMDSLIKDDIKKNNVKGISVALINDQDIIWSKSFGYSDVKNKIKTNNRTLYKVGSISKLFTDFAITNMYFNNKIDIDSPINNYVPEFSMKTRFKSNKKITPRNLMIHHSGLPYDIFNGIFSNNPKEFSELLKDLKNEYVSFPPDYVYSYSNLGVNLLGYTIEKLANKDFSSYMDENIFKTLGMNYSSYFPKNDMKSLISKAYMNGKEEIEYPLRDLPAGGLYSNVEDLSKFIKVIFSEGKINDEQVINPLVIKEMLKVQNKNILLDKDANVGLGWLLNGPPNMDYIEKYALHDGGTMYFRSMILILPEHKLGFVALSNSNTSTGIVHQSAFKAIKLALEAKSGIKEPQKSKKYSKFFVKENSLKKYQGNYSTEIGLINIKEENNILFAKAFGQQIELKPQYYNLFKPSLLLFGLIPIDLASFGFENIYLSKENLMNKDLLISKSYDKERVLGSKVEKVFLNDVWKKRLGNYKIINSYENDPVILNDIVMGYNNDNKVLYITFKVPFFSDFSIKYALEPISDTEAIVSGLGTLKGGTVKVENIGSKEIFSYSGYKFSKN